MQIAKTQNIYHAALSFGCLIALAVLFGCGGSGGDSAPLLTGKITGSRFYVAPGTARTVSGKLIIDVTDTIDIEGDLLVTPDANIGFRAPHIKVTGKIDPTPGVSVSGAKNPCGYSEPIRFVTTDLTFGSQPVRQNAQLYITTFAGANLSITGSIRAASGANGTATSINGCSGAPVEIGTVAATIFTGQFFGDNTVGYPNDINFSSGLKSTVSGGSGGDGYTDKTGKLDHANLVGQAGNGGSGAGVNVYARGTIRYANLVAGSGGAGGGVKLKGADATGRLQVGQTTVAFIGSGGNGANVNIDGTVQFPGDVSDGSGGNNGDSDLVSGNGGEGGKGGDLYFDVGKLGQAGGPRHTITPSVGLLTAGGGNGGTSTDRRLPGGAGGNLTVTNFSSTTAGATLTVSGLRGGSGASGCFPDGHLAMPGGNGGSITVQGLPYTASSACTGGAGGDGDIPGPGGIGGSDDAGKKIGLDGQAGNLCPKLKTFLSQTYFPITAGSALTYHDQGTTIPVDFTSTTGVSSAIPGTNILATAFLQTTNWLRTAVYYFRSDAINGVQNVGSVFYGRSGAIASTRVFSPPKQISEGLQINMPVVQSITETRQTAGRSPTTQVYGTTTTLLGFPTITVPAGTFTNCANVQVVTFNNGVLNSTELSWYAPGIGLVAYSNSLSGNNEKLTSFR